nr:HEAT repeat domain-containing protein [Motilibacter deserti]
MVAALEDTTLGVRAEAAYLLGGRGDPSAVPALRRALLDPEARVRVEAAAALARLGDADGGRQVLVAELEGEDFAGAPMRAARALAALGDPLGWARTLRSLDSAFPSSRMEAVAVLPLFAPFDGEQVAGDVVDVRSALWRATQDEEPLVRDEARRALEELG